MNTKQKKINGLVVIVVGTFAGLGGAERQAILLAENLTKRGVNVKLMAFSGGKVERILEEKGISYTVHNFDVYKPINKNITGLIRLIFFLRRLKPYAFVPFITLNSKIIGLIWRFTGAKFACWNQRDEGREVYGSRLEKISANNVPVIVSNSFIGKDALVERLGISQDKIVVINNGIEQPRMKMNAIDWRHKLGIEQNKPIVSMLASIYKYKDHETLLKSWRLVLDSFADNEIRPILVLAGAFKGMEDQLKILCFDLRISDSVYFTQAISDTNGLISQSNLIVHSSNKEGCPNAVLEAMALSKPVVATHISGNVQALGTEYENFCLSGSNDPIDLAKKIVFFLKNPKMSKEVATYNYKRVTNKFSIDQMVSTYIDMINKYVRV